jgi:hypothetical protein
LQPSNDSPLSGMPRELRSRYCFEMSFPIVTQNIRQSSKEL